MNQFIPEIHTYLIDGVTVPSVTGVIPKPDFFCTPEQLEAARLEGIDNHALLKMYFDSQGDTFSEPLLIMFDEWYQDNMGMLGNVVLYEESLYSKKHMFAGRPDAIFKNGSLDLKRSFSKARYHALQMAGYNILGNENGYRSKGGPWLIVWPGEKKLQSRNVYNEMAERTFLSLVKKWHIEENYEKYMETI